ncbi:MAG: tyrosine-type recombinase/integrase [Thermoguttaceae bacterium]
MRTSWCRQYFHVGSAAGWRRAAVREYKTKIDWAHEIRTLLEEDFPDAKKVILVCDNLNTHSLGAFYEAFDPALARSLARRLEIVPTPKHGSWLNIAENFAKHLRKTGYAEATIFKVFKQVKLFFNAMLEHGLIIKNVFKKVRISDRPNEHRNHYVSRDVVERIIETGCPNAEWRAFVALMRYGGMRCPSEVLLLRWSDVDFTCEKGFFDGQKKPAIKFRSIKTEHLKGGAYRVIPIFQELRPYLEEAWEAIPSGEGREYVIWDMLPIGSRQNEARRLKKNFGKAFTGILKKLNIEVWDKLFVNLRRSCRNDLERLGYPTRVLNEWMGHSEKVANAHYVQMLPEDIDRCQGGWLGRNSEPSRGKNLLKIAYTFFYMRKCMLRRVILSVF